MTDISAAVEKMSGVKKKKPKTVAHTCPRCNAPTVVVELDLSSEPVRTHGRRCTDQTCPSPIRTIA